jgi:hypothetical protein
MKGKTMRERRRELDGKRISPIPLLFLGLLLIGSWGNAWAQEKKVADKKADKKTAGDKVADKKTAGEDVSKKEEGPESPKVQVERGAGGKKVYVIKTGFVIEGRIQKPNAFYVLQRSQINYDWAALKQRFVPRIVEAVNKSPF